MKKLFLILFFSCLISVSFSQQIGWERKWAGNQPINFLAAVDKDQDTSIITSGATFQFATGPFRATFLKYDKNGNQLWQKYGRVMMSGEQDIISYRNGCLFAGSQQSSNPQVVGSDIGLHWLNSNGDTLQNNKYGVTPNDDLAIKILRVKKSLYVLGISGVSPGNLDYSLLKLSNNGTTQEWFKTYGFSTTYEYANFLLLNRRGNLIISGNTQYQNFNSTYHPYLIEVDTNGVVIQSKKIIIKNAAIHENTYRFFHNVALTADGNYIMSGSIEASNNKYENFIAKLDTAFNVLWVYYDPIQTSFYKYSKVQSMSDGSYVVLMGGDAALPGDYHVVRVSATGQFVSRTTYNSNISGHVLTYDWEFLGDGSVVIAGRTDIGEAYIARLSSVGVPAVISATAEIIAKAAKLGQSYPNPAASEITIPYELGRGTKEAELQIYEIATSRKVQELKLDLSSRQLKINLQSIKSGVYSYSLIEDGMPVATKKMVVVK